ncbi:type 1 glutamine amidotransferase domain-containing protein [Aureivirga sp. CE67]|uniref:type 1 glutamine amidotransferase domain-containing protein n=1 Tax=Aureivirga sp. CE67 TaxID=1788983 RepID=UPI0018C962F8|nr:type 1 glutamine amidotransferase domain-containing protein [Aureivirga sp. CE67]
MKIKIVTLFVMMFSLFAVSCANGDKKSENLKKEKTVAAKKVLIVLTSNNKLGDTGELTGYWIEELAAPYYELIDNGFEVELVSPKGGPVPFDPKSNAPEAITEDVERFHRDVDLQEKLLNTKKLEEIKEEDFDAIFYPGGHGLIWDLVENENSNKLIEDFNNAGKPMAFVCHGPAVLRRPKTKEGKPLVKGRKVTAFSNAEEIALQLVEVVPFLIEDSMIFRGGIYSNGENWKSYVIVDENLITGQNPASSKELGKELVKQLK